MAEATSSNELTPTKRQRLYRNSYYQLEAGRIVLLSLKGAFGSEQRGSENNPNGPRPCVIISKEIKEEFPVVYIVPLSQTHRSNCVVIRQTTGVVSFALCNQLRAVDLRERLTDVFF